ncbi:hypothetical protein FHS10_001708 [Mucilaginibacter dorajii]|uniref:Uncharacterized protein n=1 Tax=Mucilaginibacter dorajii TaxID=692994 RepID=A0ABP7QNZ9_9SPHI|nr:hypothetical protein [Mucilaginibacter dorajii]
MVKANINNTYPWAGYNTINISKIYKQQEKRKRHCEFKNPEESEGGNDVTTTLSTLSC